MILKEDRAAFILHVAAALKKGRIHADLDIEQAIACAEKLIGTLHELEYGVYLDDIVQAIKGEKSGNK